MLLIRFLLGSPEGSGTWAVEARRAPLVAGVVTVELMLSLKEDELMSCASHMSSTRRARWIQHEPCVFLEALMPFCHMRNKPALALK